MNIKKLNEELERFLEYTEEPDAFETQSERDMEKELETKYDKEMKDNTREFYKKRNGIILKVFKFLNKIKSVRDLKISKGKVPYISCYISENAFNKFMDWNKKEDNILKIGGLKMETYNASEGYYLTIS